MDDLSENTVDAIAKLAKDSHTKVVSVSLPETVKGVPSSIPLLINAATGVASSLHMHVDHWRTRPDRKTGTAVVETLASFADLVERHKTEHSAIFAVTDWRKPSMTAVIDYHGAEPDNGKHRVHYDFPLSEEWQAWLEINGKQLTQTEFAEFIEDHIADLSTPDVDEARAFEGMFSTKMAYPNDLMMVSRGLQINAETRVKSSIKLQSGESQVVFEEDHKNADGQPITVPGAFILQIAPFFQGESIRVPVRLRYRLYNGALTWTCLLYRPDIHITKAVNFALADTAAGLALPKYAGTPEMRA